MKRKADKISKESFALLDRIKARKNKTEEENLQSQVEHLYKSILQK